MTSAEFLNVIEVILELDEGTLDGSELINDLEGWDSLAVVSFIAEIDSELDLTLNPNLISNANSIADLKALVADKLTG
jgi:acyl carrier protein